MNNEKVKTTFILVIRPFITIFLLFIMFFASNLLASQLSKTEKALRLTFRYLNSKMDLINIDSLQMVIPLTIKEQILKDKEHPKGYYFELLNDNRDVILRSNLQDPTVTLLEYEDPEKPGHLKSKLVKHEDITFSFIVPALLRVRFIHFMHVIPGQETIPAEQRKHEDFGTFDLLQK